jgi:hypothetical protein
MPWLYSGFVSSHSSIWLRPVFTDSMAATTAPPNSIQLIDVRRKMGRVLPQCAATDASVIGSP